MIYEFPSASDPIRQGDIFVGLPRIDLSLQDVLVVDDVEGATKRSWADLSTPGTQVQALLPITSVIAIVASQDCDTMQSDDVTLCEVRDFSQVERLAQNASKASAWMSILTQHARLNQKWFYLPPDPILGFQGKMAVDFRVVLSVPREDLERLIGLRKGRLNAMADEHFRERVSEFFRRYPYDEWYPLNKEEFEEYKKKHPSPSVVPFPHQE